MALNSKDFIKKQARTMAEYDIEQMTEEEIASMAKKERLVCGLLAGASSFFFLLGIFAVVLMGILKMENIFMYVLVGIWAIFFAYSSLFSLNQIRQDEVTLVLKKLEDKYIAKPKLIKEEIVSKVLKDPNRVREIEVSTGLGGVKTKIIVDNKEKKIQFEIQKVKTKKFDFTEISKYEVYENGDKVVSGNVGKALVGGFFFGIGGALLATQASKRVNSNCSDLRIFIYFKDIDFPSIEIPIISSETSKSTEHYSNKVSLVKEICALLEFAINQKQLSSYEDKLQESKTEDKNTNKKSDKEKIKELKEMLDEGLISENDFEKKKKQILGI